MTTPIPAACLLLALGAMPAAAQTGAAPDAGREGPARFQLGVGLLGAAPLGTFGTNIDSAGGLSGHFGVGVGESPVTLGGEAAYLWYGEEQRRVPFSLTIPDVLVDVNTSNAMFLMHGRVRIQPRRGRWRPYVDGVVGFTDIFTTTSVDLGDACSGQGCSDVSPSTTNLRDVVASYGGGAGVMVGFGSPPKPVRLDISVRYLRGGEAEYLKQGAIRRENGQVFLDRSRSRTDMVLIFIGVSGGR